jgi:hypothetical protein
MCIGSVGALPALGSFLRELRCMNASKKKFEKVIGWTAFLASYLLVLGLTAAPFANLGTNEQPLPLKEEMASLVEE